MTKAAKSGTAEGAAGKHATPFPLFDPGDIADAGARNYEFATRAAHACFAGVAQLNWEMIGFMNKRFQKDVACAQSFMTAKTSKNAYHAQAAFLEDALRDYADGASKLLHLAADIANGALGPVEERAEEMLEELDERAAETDRAA